MALDHALVDAWRSRIEALASHESLFPGPWDGGTVHDHPAPFCWGRPSQDCTLRVVEMLRQNMSTREIASVGGMSINSLRDRLRDRGISLGRGGHRQWEPAYVALWSEMRRSGISLRNIQEIFRTLTPDRVPSLWTLQTNTVAERKSRRPVSVSMSLDAWAVDFIRRAANADGVSPGRFLEALLRDTYGRDGVRELGMDPTRCGFPPDETPDPGA